MVKTLFHGSHDYFDDILLHKCCDIGFHCGTIEQALYRILDCARCPVETFFSSYVYEIRLDINEKSLIELPDLISWADVKSVKLKIQEKYPYLNIDSIKSIIDLRNYFVNIGIKYIAYENKIEGKGMSYIILDENDTSFHLQRFTVREILNRLENKYE